MNERQELDTQGKKVRGWVAAVENGARQGSRDQQHQITIFHSRLCARRIRLRSRLDVHVYTILKQKISRGSKQEVYDTGTSSPIILASAGCRWEAKGEEG